MMGASHFLHGVTAASWVSVPLAALGTPPHIVAAAGVVGAYAALLPDIDHHSSIATWSLPPVTNFVSWVIRGCPWHFLGWDGWLLPTWLTVSTGHRRETHTEEFAVIAGLVAGLPLWLLTNWWWVFSIQVATGCLAHLWGDMRTTGGLRVRGGAPSDRRHIGRTIFDTGSDWELWLRETRYRPTAIFSALASLVLVALITSPATIGALS